MGWPEIAVILVVGLVVFGPEKLPGMAKQAGSFVRTVQQMARNAKDDLGKELGHDLSDMDLQDLHPRELVRKAMSDDDSPRAGAAAAAAVQRTLRPGEVPPWDDEAT